MAKSRNDSDIFWVDPDMRGLLPLDQFHVPRSLKKVVRRGAFEFVMIQRSNQLFWRAQSQALAGTTPGSTRK